ncbi:MAG: GrpB family protein [Acidobacteriota bacterium]|nr:GrpB family protein [Acidobacteriota bacterium]
METLEDRIKRVLQEEVSIVTYDPAWPRMFEEEKRHLLDCLPSRLIRRIEHFGSTAIPGLRAKPIVDLLVEVSSLEETKARIAPVLEAQGYDYFWRATHGEDGPPFYAWFIKRNSAGVRTHHIHMVERDFEHWDRLVFRDYLICNPETAKEYETLKLALARNYPNDRVAYTEGKTEFIVRVTQVAKEYYRNKG